MSKLLDRLASGQTLVSDGGTGTYLQSKGLEAGGCPEAFNDTHGDIIQTMASDYFAAGSDMVETNTFGGSRYMLGKYDLGDQVERLNRLGVQHAKAAATQGQLVVGSIGPTGELLVPNGTAPEAEMFDVFCQQVRGLAAGGADGICIETMSDIAEMTLAIRAARQESDLPVLATLTFDRGPRGYFTMMGITPQSGAQQLTEAGADIVGSNCGIAIEQMIEIIAAMRAVTDKPILTHVNAGIPKIVSGKIIYPHTPEVMAARIPALMDAGANIIGGCCGTGPDHVRAFARVIKGTTQTS